MAMKPKRTMLGSNRTVADPSSMGNGLVMRAISIFANPLAKNAPRTVLGDNAKSTTKRKRRNVQNADNPESLG